MVYWFYDRKDLKCTPSVQDSILMETEMRYRKEGARFIMDLGNKIGLRYDTVATGVVFMHRFYMFHSFKEFDRYVTACCCLFLAGKVEETPKKAKDIIKQAKALLPDAKFAAFGADPKEEVMTMERILLQTIKFDLQVDHPYTYLIKYAKCLKGDKAKLHKCVQMAWTFVNDSLCTTLCLQWEPEIIAIALMYLAGKLSKFEVVDWVGRQPHHLRWWDMFVEDISMELLEDVCHQVLDLYTQAKVGAESTDSPPPTAVAAAKLEPAETTPQGSAAVSADTTPKKRATPPTPPGASVKPVETAATAAPTPAPVTGSSASAAAGFGYGYASGGSGYGFNYPPPSGGAAPPPPPAPAAPAAPPPAAVGATAQFTTQFPPYGYSAGEVSSPVVAPPPPPLPSSKYAPPPLPPGPGGAPPGPLPPRHAFPPHAPPGPAPPPPAGRGYFPPQGGPPPGYRPGGPAYPPGHRPF